MRIKSFISIFLSMALLAFLASHFYPQFFTTTHLQPQPFSDQDIQRNTSSPLLSIKKATVLTDNDGAFAEKIRMINEATETLDIAYYIYSDDYSSSHLSKTLIAAANRGVRVRLLVDYQATYSNFDLFSMLEHYGNQGKGSLNVRFYNRPTIPIIKDAVFLTLGCSEVHQENNLKACSKEKYKVIEQQFMAQDGESEAETTNRLLNYNNGRSGLFLSAFYAKNPRLIALAIQQGQALPSLQEMLTIGKTSDPYTTTEKTSQLSNALSVYMTARHGSGLERISANLKFKFALAFLGDKINPYYDALTSYFPIGRDQPRKDSLRDWNYITDYLHQKLLLVDGQQFILGGRNIEDTYHMQAHQLMKHYQFMDTDVSVELNSKENHLTTAFERLWNFNSMVATTQDVQQHAPNDFLVSTRQAEKKCASLKDQTGFQVCYETISQRNLNKFYRIKQAYTHMLTHAAQYVKNYRKPNQSIWPKFAIDSTAESYYIENLPFNKTHTPLSRHYGAENGKEADSGKYIHHLWLAALRHTCQQATAEHPQEVMMHNAYFFMPSNLLRQVGDMLSGKRDCQYVHITILTNSLNTTDLGIVNLASKYSLKALLEHVETAKKNGQTTKSATLSYYEYHPETLAHGIRPSLHSKVMLIGEELFIGSANADIRSYMMDANNGLLIRKAPKLMAHYRQWFKHLLADKKRTQDKTQQLKDSAMEQWLTNDTQQLIAIVQKQITTAPAPSTKTKNPASSIATVLQQQIDKRLQHIFKTIYSLSKESLHDEKGSATAQKKFNALFKLI